MLDISLLDRIKRLLQRSFILLLCLHAHWVDLALHEHLILLNRSLEMCVLCFEFLQYSIVPLSLCLQQVSCIRLIE